MPHRYFFAMTLILGAGPTITAADDSKGVVPLRHAHAHNDYEHARPLLDALAHGFCSVEADIFLRDGQLLVGHAPRDLKPERTLERLYLNPLRERVRAHGRVYPAGPQFFLLIDIKTDPKATYVALDKVLAGYADILSNVENGEFHPGAVTVVVSGNRDRRAMAEQQRRFAGMDGRLTDLDSQEPAHLIPWISDRWTSVFKWRGEGRMPDAERARLKEIVAKAHARGRLVRFWDTPEDPAVWKELRDGGVDLINTDSLPTLRRFLSTP